MEILSLPESSDREDERGVETRGGTGDSRVAPANFGSTGEIYFPETKRPKRAAKPGETEEPAEEKAKEVELRDFSSSRRLLGVTIKFNRISGKRIAGKAKALRKRSRKFTTKEK